MGFRSPSSCRLVFRPVVPPDKRSALFANRGIVWDKIPALGLPDMESKIFKQAAKQLTISVRLDGIESIRFYRHQSPQDKG
jgi:hypothetical protein